MFGRYQTNGATAAAADIAHLTKLLDRAPRSYAVFTKDASVQWAKG